MDFSAIPKDVFIKSYHKPSFFTASFLFNPDKPSERLIPYDYQEEVLDSPARYKVLRQGRQTGKTLEMAIMALHDIIFHENFHVVFIGPNEHHLARFWDERLRPLLNNSIFRDTIVVDRKTPTYFTQLENGSYVQGFVGNSDKTELRGMTSDHLIVDECFDKYTKVITNEGIKPLYMIKSGDIIMGADGKFTKVLVSRETGIKDVYKVNSDVFSTPLYVTADHPFFYNGEWVSIADLDEISFFVGVNQEVITAATILAFNYVVLLHNFDESYISVDIRDIGIEKYINLYIPNRYQIFKSRDILLEKVNVLSPDEKLSFLRVVMRFLSIIPRELVSMIREFNYNVKYDALDFESSNRFIEEVGTFGDTNGYSKVVKMAKDLGIEPADVFTSKDLHYDRIYSTIRLPIEKTNDTRRVVWNLKTASGHYMIYHDGKYIPVHNCDYLREEKWTAINGSLIARPNHKKTIASTPTPKRGLFYEACHDKSLGFKEFHIPATRLPHWTWIKDAERLGIGVDETTEYIYRKAFPIPGDWEREVLAEFFDFHESVIPSSAIDDSFKDYDDTKEKLGPRVMGVDWNSSVHGIVMVILEWMKDAGKYRVVHTEVVSHNEYNHIVAIERIKTLLDEYDYDFLYVDYGYGEQDVEILMKYGYDRNISVFKDIFRVRFNENIQVATSFGVNNYMLKEFIIKHASEVFRNRNIILPPSEDDRISLNSQDTLAYQLRNLYVRRVTPNGRIIYDVTPDHHLAAFLCALYGFVNEFQPTFDPVGMKYRLDVKDITKRGIVNISYGISTGNIYRKYVVERTLPTDIRKRDDIKEFNSLDDFLKS